MNKCDLNFKGCVFRHPCYIWNVLCLKQSPLPTAGRLSITGTNTFESINLDTICRKCFYENLTGALSLIHSICSNIKQTNHFQLQAYLPIYDGANLTLAPFLCHFLLLRSTRNFAWLTIGNSSIRSVRKHPYSHIAFNFSSTSHSTTAVQTP